MDENSNLQNLVHDALDPDKKGKAQKFASTDFFRDELLSFITNQANLIDGDNKIITQIKEELSAKIELHELDVGELLSVLKAISDSGNKRLDSMFKLIMPSQSSSNHLLPPAQVNEEEEEAIFDPQERRTLHKLYMLLQEAENRQEEHQEDE